MKPGINKTRIFHMIGRFKQVFYRVSNGNKSKRKIFGKNPLKLNMKSNSILAIVLIAVMMVSVFACLSTEVQSKPNIVPVVNDPTGSPSPTAQQTANPSATGDPAKTQNIGLMFNNAFSSISDIVIPPRAPGLIESNPNVTSQVWKGVAANAWNYFQPSTGVDINSGLPKASLVYPYFTDWDLGVYIQACIDANKTGLIGNDDDWGFNSRINKALTFLETRDLNTTTNYPFWFYQATDGRDFHAASDLAKNPVETVDSGRLFVALNNLKTYNPNLATRVNNFVYNINGNRSDYSSLVPAVFNDCKSSISFYTYYYANGFASFWPTELSAVTVNVLNNIQNQDKISTYGVSLPKATISCEPLLCSVFELNNNSQLTALAKQVYLAHEAKSNATGQYVAFSEGNTATGFIYEWVMLPSGDAWKIMNNGESTYSDSDPIIYYKVSLSFLALYNTTFARNMSIYLEKALPDPTSGYYAGAEYNDDTNRASTVQSIDSNSNGMILGAARYFIQNFP